MATQARQEPSSESPLRLVRACAVDKDAAQAGDEGVRIVRFTLSTADVDRQNDTIAQDGWDLGNFASNGVVLWCHDSCKPPVAKALKTWSDGTALRSIAQFATRDEYDFADTVYRLLRGGYLNAVSVGFKPIEWKMVDRESNSFGYDFLKQELLEYSVVPVPAHPGALVEARAAGIEMAPVIEWAEKALDESHKSGLWIPRAELERAWFEARSQVSEQVPTAPVVETPEKDISVVVVEVTDDDDAGEVEPVEPMAEPGDAADAPAEPGDTVDAELCPMCLGDGVLDDGSVCSLCDGAGAVRIENDGKGIIEIDDSFMNEIAQELDGLLRARI